MSEIAPKQTSSQALRRLKEGNARYVQDQCGAYERVTAERRGELVGGQSPFAIVLACADSRVPPEAVFDCGLGELFTIRVAGNVATPTQIGSIEYAAKFCGARLIVVLGHSGCGAVQATLSVMDGGEAAASPGLAAVVEPIRAAIEDGDVASEGVSQEQRIADGVRANVRAAAQELRQSSPMLRELITADGLSVVGAEYDLKSGAVTFFDGVD